MEYSGKERFKCGCVLYMKETEDGETIVKVEKCDAHKKDEEYADRIGEE